MPIKILLLCSGFLFVSCTKERTVQPYVLHENRTAICQEEIEQSIAALIGVKTLSLSKDVFSQTSFLYLTNQKNGILTQSPIVNDLRGRKALKMYQVDKQLFIGLLNEKKELIKFEELVNCSKD